MTGRNMNVYFQEETYNQVKSLIAKREISRFINEAVAEKLQQKQQQQKEELKKKLIAGYQARNKQTKLQKTLHAYGEMSWEDISANLDNEQKKQQP